MSLWTWQQRGLDETIAAIESGVKRIVVTGPTGSGKSRQMMSLLEWGVATKRRGALFTNRRMLCAQLKTNLEAHGIFPGMRASGWEPAYLRDVQLCMTQTEHNRAIANESRELHDCKLVLIDEIHTQKGEQMQAIVDAYLERGAAVVMYTATPLDLGNIADKLIVAGTVSECRAGGALVAARHFACDEPDMRHIKNYRIGEDVSEADNRKAIMRPGVFGRVLENYQRLNPNGDPAILFGPDVAGALFFAQEFSKAGFRTAHIDGERCWINGEEHPANEETRQQIADGSKSGEIEIVTNRFVLREGIDWPWLSHGVLACVMGSLTTYLQSVGRLLRAYPGKQTATIQDHGGAWWRHGSVNMDRDWRLGETNTQVCSQRAERMREKKEHEPITCPACQAVRKAGDTCPACGHKSTKRARIVVQVNGSLREVEGDVFKARKQSMKSDTQKLWEQCYFRMKRAGKTFSQARGLFFYENHYWPPNDLPFMPKDSDDWCRKISAVSADKLFDRSREQEGAFQ